VRFLRPRLLLASLGLAGATLGTAGVAATTAATAPSASAAVTVAPGAGQNPYLPSNGHPYRHGAEPSRGQSNDIRTWNSQHPAAQGTAGKAAIGANTMEFYGGINGGEGAVTSTPKIYLVFWGTQWGTQGTDGNGDLTFSGDPDGGAPYIQQLFKGLGTDSELWSGTMTQYCDGPTVAAGATSCPAGAPHVAYPSGGVALAGVWYDNSAAEPSAASVQQLANVAGAAAAHFGNTTSASNRYVQYDVLSAPGTNPDNYLNQGFCAWHDYATSSYGDIAFTNMPYVMNAGASCGQGFVNSPGTLDGYSIVNGHEYAETLTDEFPNAGWLSSSGNEVGDECAWISSGTGAAADVTLSTGSFAVQSIWSNDTNNCAISHPIVTGSTGNTVSVTNPGTQTGAVGTAASLQIQSSDSQSGQTLTYTASGLPAGLSINSASGLITGTPTTSGTNSATVTASDTTGAHGSASFSWTINAAGNTVTVTNPGSQSGTVGSTANLQIHASDSASGQTLTYSASGLPPTLFISSSSGLITGSETTAGTFSATVTATDTTGAHGSATFSWTVSSAGNTVTVTNPGSKSGNVGTATSLQIHASDSQSGQTLTYKANGLPAGLTINGSSGLISGTPTTAKTYSVTVTATDTTGAHGSAAFSWTIRRHRA
jgi:hypothetical protein